MPTDPDTDLRNAHDLLQQGQLDEAVRTYVQLADDYWLEEKYAAADAVYKKALEADHDFLLKGDVFSPQLIDRWISYKRDREITPMRMRPHPLEFSLYYDI